VDILTGVLRQRRSLDEQLEGAHSAFLALAERDRALTRMLVGTALRRLGTLRHLFSLVLDHGLPADAPRLESVLAVGAVQLLWLDVPDHAAVDLAVRLAQADRHGARYAGLVNAVLRRLTREGNKLISDLDAANLDTPAWLLARWSRTYGSETAHAIARAHAQEPALDLTVKDDPAAWADRLRGQVLVTGTVRMIPHGPVSLMPGYAEGAWWVQDAAAALPARLLGDVRGRSVADLCAAPGGKTAQLAYAGARVTAVDRSPARMARVRANLVRLGIEAQTFVADAADWQGGPFDAVLLDAPCTSTGTIRRHPDIPWLKSEADIAALASTQARLLAHAVRLLKPDGIVVYSTCSLEPEEGEVQVAQLLASEPRLRRAPIHAAEINGCSDFVTAEGDLRTLPCHLPNPDPRMAGLDGFYAARLKWG
jgi:16S rRNA (cytosine967-C5)-methyltransferase